MRARGAMITDVAILVVAADDGIMPQTIEAINHAKAAEIPIIVAINKMDKPGANPDRVMPAAHRVRRWCPRSGAATPCICPDLRQERSMGIDNLLEMVILHRRDAGAEGQPQPLPPHGAVIEASLDKGRGPVATLLVQNGTLHHGRRHHRRHRPCGRVRAMMNAAAASTSPRRRPAVPGGDHWA